MRLIICAFALCALSSCGGPSGTPAETGEPKTDSAATAASAVADSSANATFAGVPVDLSQSKIDWVGAKVTGKHTGTLNLKGGGIVVENGELKGGEIVLDMTSITVTDLKGEEKGKLEGHLKTGDFFETDKYPTGKFVLTGAKAEKKGDNTHMLEGNLTLKGIEKGVKFPAKVELTNEGKGAKIIAKDILIDRTLWGITYKGMADNAIKNDIGLSFTVVTKN